MKPGKPRFVAVKSRFLRRKRIVKAERDVASGLVDTERRGTPSDVPHGGTANEVRPPKRGARS